MSNEELYMLKIGEYRLASDKVCRATESLITGAIGAGKSQHQVLVLKDDIEQLSKAVDQLNEIKWPATVIPPATKGG